MTLKSGLHELVGPWCAYALPKTITLPPSGTTFSETTVTAPLEPHASHGSCPSSRAVTMAFTVEDTFSGFPFIAETGG